MDDLRDQILFMTVPPPRSGNVVRSLRRVPAVVSAAAVYSGIDVVARLHGTEADLRAARAAIDGLGAPIRRIEEFAAQYILHGPRFHDSTVRLRSACHAFVRCTIDREAVAPRYAAELLQELSCAVSVAYSDDSETLVLEVLSADKGQFDVDVMSGVQSEWTTVTSTRTYLVINSMTWADWIDDLGPTIFISTSRDDAPFADKIKQHIESDTGLRCWKYDDDIPFGESNWPMAVDEAMRAAPLHLYLLSEAQLRSNECQREFGQSLHLVEDQRDICGFVVPGFDASRLDERYRSRTHIAGDSIFAYSHLLAWVHDRLKAAGGRSA